MDNTARDTRKRLLERRIASYKQMEKLCYEFQQKLEKELQVIEEEEFDEYEAHLAQRRTA